MKTVSGSEMKKIEETANAGGLGYDQMMQNAGTSLAHIILKRYPSSGINQVLGLVGSGNNGGDTLIALRILQQSGWHSTACLVKKRSDDDPLVASLANAGGEIIHYWKDINQAVVIRSTQKANVILDGILGTGFKLPLREKSAGLLKLVSDYMGKAYVVAVDCPSGVDCDSGDCAPETLHADLTVSMAAVKQGLLKLPAIGLVGEIVNATIGLPEKLFDPIENKTIVAECGFVKNILPKRLPGAHKGMFGKSMVCGGSINYPGAPLLAAEGAYRVGAGLVCTAIPASIYDSIAGRLPESIWLMLPDEMGLLNEEAAKVLVNHFQNYDAILIGPGLGLDKSTKSFLKFILNSRGAIRSKGRVGFLVDDFVEKPEEYSRKRIVFDADALRILSEIENWYEQIDGDVVITPHPGEMAALTGLPIKEVQENRIEIARKFAKEWGLVVVLKGAGTIIAAPQEECVIIPIATPALATAGTGDVLAGMITGFLAQGMHPFDAAVSAAWVHGVAGIEACRSHGQSASVIARDVILQIPTVLKNITAYDWPSTP